MKIRLPDHLPEGDRIARILDAALRAVDPAAAVKRVMQLSGERLNIAGQDYDLSAFRHVWLVGAGKAGASMASAAQQVLAEHLDGGVVIVKEGHITPSAGVDEQALHQISQRLSLIEASHPVPDERGMRAATRMADLLRNCQEDDLVICLISGGGSALLTAPPPGISLDDLQALTQMLLASGASIDEINSLRKHLDQLKGGQLARLAYPARIAALILSDVVGSELDVIASGPTVPDQSTYADAWEVLRAYNLLERIPSAIREYLEKGCRGILPDTPKPGDLILDYVQNVIIGSNQQAADAALAQSRAEGFNSLVLSTYMQGEARQAGRMLAAIARQVVEHGQPIAPPACIISGGETTVTLHGDGLGGRNLELALGAARELDGLPGAALITLATDGGDGPTDAAGAVVTGETFKRAAALGMLTETYLRSNDSYHFFQALGDLLITGPTGTNVNDLAFLFLLG